MFKLRQTNQTTCCTPCMQDNLSFQFQKPIGLICRLHAVCSEFLLSAPWAKNPHVSLPLQTCENSSKRTPLHSQIQVINWAQSFKQQWSCIFCAALPPPPPCKKKHMRKVKYFSRQHIFGSFVMLAKYHQYWSCIFAQLCPTTPRKKCKKCRKFVALHPRWVDDASRPGPQSLDFLESWWFPRDPQHQGHIAKCLHFRSSKPLSIQHIEQRQLKHHSFNACWCDLLDCPGYPWCFLFALWLSLARASQWESRTAVPAKQNSVNNISSYELHPENSHGTWKWIPGFRNHHFQVPCQFWGVRQFFEDTWCRCSRFVKAAPFFESVRKRALHGNAVALCSCRQWTSTKILAQLVGSAKLKYETTITSEQPSRKVMFHTSWSNWPIFHWCSSSVAGDCYLTASR